MFCMNCGQKVPDESKFCPSCGTLLYREEEQTTVEEHVPAIEPSLKSEPEPKPESEIATTSLHQKEEVPKAVIMSYQQTTEAVSSPADNIEDVIGKNATYYLGEFKKVEEGQKTKFNLAAFFLGVFFCFYRKCGDLFKKYFLIPIAIMIVALIVTSIAFNSFSLPIIAFGGILSTVGSVWALINYIRFGKNFNKEYYAHCKAILATGNKKKYGTSISSVIIVLAAVVVLSLIPSAISVFSMFGGSTDSGNFSGLGDISSSSAILLDGEYAIVEDATSGEYIYLNFNWNGDGTLQICSSDNPTQVIDTTYRILPTKDIMEGVDSYSIMINNDYLDEEIEVFEFCSWMDDGTYYVRLSEELAEGEMLSAMMFPFTEEYGFYNNMEDRYVESGLPDFSNSYDISGDWQDSWSERCCMTITAEGNDFYSVDVIWASGASAYDEWIFNGYYDSSTGILSYENGMWVSYDEELPDDGAYIVLDGMKGQLFYDGNTIFWSDYTSPEYNLDFGSSEMRFEKW